MPGPAVYQPALQFSHPFATVMVRVSEPRWRRAMFSDSAQPMFETLRRALNRIDPNLPMFDALSLNDMARAGRADRAFESALLTACALIALLLAAVGIYSLTAAWFQSRRKEMGVRVALGASPVSLMRVIMSGALWRTGLGVILGIGLALAAGRALRRSFWRGAQRSGGAGLRRGRDGGCRRSRRMASRAARPADRSG